MTTSPRSPCAFLSRLARARDILRKRLLGRLSDLNLTEARVQLQDKFLRVKKAEEAKGNTNSDLSAYQAESLYYHYKIQFFPFGKKEDQTVAHSH